MFALPCYSVELAWPHFQLAQRLILIKSEPSLADDSSAALTMALPSAGQPVDTSHKVSKYSSGSH